MAAGDWGDGQTFPELNELAAAVDDIVEEGTSTASPPVTLTEQAVMIGEPPQHPSVTAIP
jgi:hypothetical protein